MSYPEETSIRLLSTVEVLEPLRPEEVANLDRRTADLRLEPGEILFAPHEAGEKLFFLKEGRIRIFTTTPEGRELTLEIVNAGEILGEMALTAQSVQGAYAQAVEPSTVSVVSREELELLILEKPEVGLKIVHLLSERLRTYAIRMEDLGLRGAPARLASVILLLIESEGVVSGRGLKVPTRYSHQHLGTMIGVSREAVTRAFAQLQDEGAVELVRRNIYVTDREALKRIAGRESSQE
jgi:CRP/FNR family transcriptional regulator, cyclic AMP receptor protein